MDKELKAILKSSSLLLVEDDIKIREKFGRLLGIYVNKIYEASNGKKALEIYKRYKPSFIITDIEMPDMDGLEFVDILKKENDSIPVIITSAYSNKEYLLLSIKLQLSDYLIKPIGHDELLYSLEKVAKMLKKITFSNIIEITNEVTYNPSKKVVSICGVTNHLTVYEDKLLVLLLINRGTVVTKHMVEEKLYIFKAMSDSALKNIIYKLRKKLLKDIIISVDRLGYKID